jgi:hypothetical protein
MNLSFLKTLQAHACLLTVFTAALSTSLEAGDICVAENVAAASGWHLNWVVQLPFDSDRTQLEAVSISDELVVATTGDGRVHAYHEGISPLAGTLSWSDRIDNADEPGLPADIGRSLVVVTRGSNVYGFDRSTGDPLWREQLGRMPHAPAVEGDNWVYTPYGSLRILRLSAYPNKPPTAMRQAMEEDPTRKSGFLRASLEDQSPLLLDAGTSFAKAIHRLSPYSVGWIGGEGTLYTLNDLENGWKRHELRLGSIASGDFIHRDNAIWMALSSGDLIGVLSDPSAGLSVTWRAPLAKQPSGGLLVDGETLLASMGTWGLEGRSAANGELIWSRDREAVSLLAAGGGMAWTFSVPGRLELIDLADGSVACSLHPGRYRFVITNTVTNRLYLATHDGVIASLSPPVESVAVPAVDETPAATNE